MGDRGEVQREAIVPRHWRAFYDASGVPAALRVGDELRVTGHTGEFDDGQFSPDPATQIRQTFTNLTATLADSGFQWSDVIELSTFHVGLLAQAEMVLEIAAAFLPRPYPAWTAVGVTELILPEALVEISCVARRLAEGQPTTRLI